LGRINDEGHYCNLPVFKFHGERARLNTTFLFDRAALAEKLKRQQFPLTEFTLGWLVT
jgi:hypothetical protein